MYLKRISINGFKSFCDRVEFDFGPGVTCVVGPNGCGKSNVVDAFKWVLGEQSAHSLRGRQMSDMIFNGSSTRRASGVAQVDLVFDNADRCLPMDYEEITVTRKLFRSGDSEYLLNQQPARLKDIRELFLDTGVGVDAYSVIEQGKVDSLLKSNPQDRRIIFEEAAGISRYKSRKREAQRKLERTQQNLLRVADIIEELEKRLRSVKLQAGKARSFLEYEARLRELKSAYTMAEFHRFTVALQEINVQIADATDETVALRAQIDRVEVESSQLALLLDELAEQINVTDSGLVQAKADRASHEERCVTSKRRIDEQVLAMQRVQERRVVDAARFESAARELAGAEQSEQSLHVESAEANARIDALVEEDRLLAREMTAAQALMEDEKAGIIDLLRKSAQIHNEIIRFHAHTESLVGQKGRLSQRDAQILSELEAQFGRQAELEAKLADVDSLIARETSALAQKKAEVVRVNEHRQHLVEELASGKERRSAMASRRDLLEDLERRREGVGSGVRQVLAAAQDCGGGGVVGLVGDMFEADLAYAPLVEAALGECDQHLVVQDTGLYYSLLDRVGSLSSRVHAICLDRLGPVVNDRDYSGAQGFVARMLDVVRYSPAMESLAKHLFGKMVIVEDRASALAMSAEDVTGHRFVTRAGEVVSWDGRVGMGPATSEAGLISRRSERQELSVQLAALDVRVRALAAELERTHDEIGHLDLVQQELRTALYELNTAKVEANSTMQRIRETIHRLSEERPLISTEVALLEQQIDEIRTKAQAGDRSLEAIQSENTDRERNVDLHQRRIDDIVNRRKGVQERITDAKVIAGQFTEKRAALTRALAGLRREMGELESAVASADADLSQCQARMQEARGVLAASEAGIAEVEGLIVELERRAGEARDRRDAARLEQEAAGNQLRVARGALASAEGRLHERQTALAEVNVRREDLVGRVRDELGVDLPVAYERYEHQERDWQEVENEIAELRGRMERLGNVNLDAIKELEELEQRHGFLAAQRDDLEQSHRQLCELIEKLNLESTEKFRSTFEQVRDHFRAMFRRLFGGGKADILLEDPENLLESGIEIVAQPPGKELQAISLMSGGEKSMTAIALLMSIFQSRPAPFAIMDEVDAALDEANNERFNRIVKEFVQSVQFIVITHSKWTMNVADRLYGITMQEPGISTRVSVQLTTAHVA